MTRYVATSAARPVLGQAAMDAAEMVLTPRPQQSC